MAVLACEKAFSMLLFLDYFIVIILRCLND